MFVRLNTGLLCHISMCSTVPVYLLLLQKCARWAFRVLLLLLQHRTCSFLCFLPSCCFRRCSATICWKIQLLQQLTCPLWFLDLPCFEDTSPKANLISIKSKSYRTWFHAIFAVSLEILGFLTNLFFILTFPCSCIAFLVFPLHGISCPSSLQRAPPPSIASHVILCSKVPQLYCILYC